MERTWSVRADSGPHPEYHRVLGKVTGISVVDGEIVLHVASAPGRTVRVYSHFLCPCLEAFVELLGPKKALAAPEKTRIVKACCIDGNHLKCPKFPERCDCVLHFFDGRWDDVNLL